MVLVVAVVSVLGLSACKKSSHAAAKSSSRASTTVNTSSGTTGTTTGSTAAPSSSTSQPANSSKLLANVCSMLDPSTITSVMGVAAQPTQELSADGDRAGGCLYGKFPGGFQTTTFTGANFDRDKLGWKLGFPAVSGVGNAAYSRGAVPLGNTKNVVVYVDYGDFGMEFAGTSPNATVAQVVKVAQSIK
jgi:hypothetical protein